MIRAQGFWSIQSLCVQDSRPARTPAEQAEEHIRPQDQDIGSTDDDIHRLCVPAHAILSKGPAGSPPRSSTCLAQETSHNNRSFTHHRKVNTGIDDPSSQDSIRTERLAEKQTLQENRDNMQEAYDARSIDPDNNDPSWGSLSPRELLGLEDCLFWYDTKIAELDVLLIPGPQISIPLISRLTIRPPDREGVPDAEGYQTQKVTRRQRLDLATRELPEDQLPHRCDRVGRALDEISWDSISDSHSYREMGGHQAGRISTEEVPPPCLPACMPARLSACLSACLPVSLPAC